MWELSSWNLRLIKNKGYGMCNKCFCDNRFICYLFSNILFYDWSNRYLQDKSRMEKKEIMLGLIIKIKQLIQNTPNDQELGAKIRELAYKTELINPFNKKAYNKSSDD